MQTRNCDVLIVGGGPGGYVAAIRAGQLGLDTVLVEARELGGTCLNEGCIPSKALIYAAARFDSMNQHALEESMGISLPSAPQLDFAGLITWKQGVVRRLNQGVSGLLKRAKVSVVRGWAQFSDAKHCRVETAEGGLQIVAQHVILANGSVSTELPNLPFGDHVISSSEALTLPELPASVAIIGGGYIGLELGTALSRLGSQVTVIESREKILPLYDEELTRPVATWLRKRKVEVKLETSALGVEELEAGVRLRYREKHGSEGAISVDKVLVTVGRRPNTRGWGLENMCVDMQGPFIKVDQQCRTAMKNVWAIGDLVGEPMLAHKASAQGEMVAELIAGKRRAFDPVAIPAVCFTEPEIVSCGLSPEQARAAGYEVLVSQCSLASIGKAHAMNAADDGGFVRIAARADNHLVLGIQAVGKHLSELSGEFVLALEMGARLEDLAHTIHMHPTLGEATFEAALAGLGLGVHC